MYIPNFMSKSVCYSNVLKKEVRICEKIDCAIIFPGNMNIIELCDLWNLYQMPECGPNILYTNIPWAPGLYKYCSIIEMNLMNR